MKDHYGIRVSTIFNLCDYKIKINDVCWNKVKMTSSKWIVCFHQSYDSLSSRITNSFQIGSPSSFNTFDGRRYKWSPSISFDNSVATTQSPSNSSPVSLSSSDWGNHSQSSVSSSSIASSNSTFQIKSTPKQITKFGYDLSYSRNNHCKSKDDSIMRELSQSQTLQSIITIINPFEYLLINCETNIDTNCAQISPEQEIIAVSNEYWLAFYSIRDNDCLGTVQFPNRCLYWTWYNGDSVAIITENDVFHWCLESPKPHQDFPKLIFSLDEEIKNYQIVNYVVDPLYGCWCAVSALFLENDGEIGGKIQIYSLSYMQSQCIEAHSCLFVSYRFEGSTNNSNLLIAVKRENRDLWKLYIIELSAMPNGHFKNRPLKSQQLMLHGLQTSKQLTSNNEMPFDDIPTHITYDGDVGLIFIVSKYGSIYICDLETGTPLYYDSISQWTNNEAIFSLSYDHKNTCLIAICRNGRVLVIKILLKQLLSEHKNKFQSNVLARISDKLGYRKLPRVISYPNSSNNEQLKNNNNNNVRTVNTMINKKQMHDGANISSYNSEKSDENHSRSYYDDQDDFEEEVTRL